MAQIVINEVSQNYTYNIGSNAFCTVALPITASWGPGFIPGELMYDKDAALENTSWEKYPATQQGLEAFVSAYRGPAANYRAAKDYSYHMAMSLLAAGYDVLVCRLCQGSAAKTTLHGTDSTQLDIQAKYPGTFGNSLRVSMKPVKGLDANNQPINKYWNAIVYVEDSSGSRSAVENLVFAFDLSNSTDIIPHVSEIESNFIKFVQSGSSVISVPDTIEFEEFKVTAENPNPVVSLTGGDDNPTWNAETEKDPHPSAGQQATNIARIRYEEHMTSETFQSTAYFNALRLKEGSETLGKINLFREWTYTAAHYVYELLTDKLTYNPNRIISPWDDQNVSDVSGEALPDGEIIVVSPLHSKLMEVAALSRCGTALLDIPKSLPKGKVYNTSLNSTEEGYAQKLARTNPTTDPLYSTHSALFAPWGQYKYVGTAKQAPANPSFLALIMQRAMLLNQSLQYEWAMPSNRKHNLSIGKLDYTVSKKTLDEWQKLDGVGVNVITSVPDLGTTLWGNSTLFEVPPATYQALANLSTRFLMNAVKNIVYRAGVSITFNYNNDEAYSKFYAAVTPILDTMKNVGAIDGYYVKMAADINGLDQVNANTVIGKVYLVVNGVINDIIVDLVALPPGTDLTQFQS